MNAPLPYQPPSKPPQFQLKRLSPKHRQVAALLSQGLGRSEISKIVDLTPEYITMLGHQPLFIDYLQHMSKFADARLVALHDKAIDVVARLMDNGSEDAQLRAAQTTLKALHKDGQETKAPVNVKFVVKMPGKAPSSEDWAARFHVPVVLENDAQQEPRTSPPDGGSGE